MYRRILIVVDQRPVTQAAVLEGIALAAAHGAEAHFFCVLPRFTMPVPDAVAMVAVSADEFLQLAKADADKALKSASKVAEAAGVMAHCEMGSGDDDADCIIEQAKKRRSDVIVVASEGRNALMRLLTGSVIPGLITASPIPVLICKPRAKYRAGIQAMVQAAEADEQQAAATTAPARLQ
jgi:nucleotide-binding universal stress UspA family protein